MVGGFEAIIPDFVIEDLKRTQINLGEFDTDLMQCLSMAEDLDVIAEMPPLHRAQFFLVLAKSAIALFTLRLRCSGIQSDNHAVQSENVRNLTFVDERLRLFEEKFDRYNDFNKSPVQPSTTINYQAATRFIEHSLPDLTSEQRTKMRDISRGVRVPQNNHKKRKHRSQPENKSACVRAAEFLSKATKELVCPDNGGLKGPFAPLRCEASDEEGMQIE